MRVDINKLIVCFVFLAFFSSDLKAQKELPLITNGQTFVHKKRDKHDNNNSDCGNSEFRSIDGVCNNRRHEEWGASDIELYREMESEYGSSDHYNAMAGEERPSPRAISNALCDETETIYSSFNLSSFVFTWGQFLDHDISLTPEAHIEYEPIGLPSDEPLFTSEIPFFRSAVHEDTGVENYRQQSNLITSWIDASNVYGSDEERADWLRTKVDGKLKMSEGMLLPYNTVDGELASEIDPDAPSMAGDGSGQNKVFVAGDIRANEQPGLTALHTLFVRLHNRTCNQLIQGGMRGDQQLYLNARKKVAGIIQSITYNEFLPALGVELRRERNYDDRKQADITNIFATAAYRLGHTMVTDHMLLVNSDCSAVGTGELSLIDGFFNPEIIKENKLEPVLKGLSAQVQNEVDLKITDNLRNFLFGDPNAGPVFGLDLASLNIQRGRDHGLPDYNTIRKKYTDREARSFRDITRDQEVQQLLEELYGDVDSIDPWIGFLAEDKRRNSSLGNTLHEILRKQFEALRDGDRFFYMYDRTLNASERREIDRTRLSDVIKENTAIDDIQRNVFIAESCEAGSKTDNTVVQRANSVQLEATVYPNPVKDILIIQLGDTHEVLANEQLLISDNLGRIVKSTVIQSRRIEMDVSDLDTGIYFIRVKDKQEYQPVRFVKAD